MRIETPQTFAERIRKYKQPRSSKDYFLIGGKLRVDFAVRAKVERISLHRFLLACTEAYVREDPEFMLFWDKVLVTDKKISRVSIKDHIQRRRERQQGEALMKLLGIVDDPEEQKLDFYERLKKEEKLNDRE